MSDYLQLGFAILACWIGMGLVGGAMYFASIIRCLPSIALDQYNGHVKFFRTHVFFGPIGLISSALVLTIGKGQKVKYSGMLFPGKAAREEARRLQNEWEQIWDKKYPVPKT